MQLINTELIGNPANWLIVILMILIAVFGLNLLMPTANQLESATLKVI